MKTAARGRALARALIKAAIAPSRAIEASLGRKPQLAIVGSADADGRRFVEIKRKALHDVAIEITAKWLDRDSTTADCVSTIEQLNAAHDVDAIFLQFPLPDNIDPQMSANTIALHKDIDCSSDRAEQAFLAGQSPYVPVAPQAALDLLANGLEAIHQKNIVVYGDDDAFNRALKALLLRQGAQVDSYIGAADALVFAATPPREDLLEQIRSIDLVLDAGYYLPPRPANVIPDHVRNRIGTLLTQYGNVGPLTVAHLAVATSNAAKRSPTGMMG